MLGPLAEEDLLALFQESAIYLCTSRYEPFGLAPLEAALCGCAVVANDIESLREVWGGRCNLLSRCIVSFGAAGSAGKQSATTRRCAASLVASCTRIQRLRMAEQYLGLYRNMDTTPC